MEITVEEVSAVTNSVHVESYLFQGSPDWIGWIGLTEICVCPNAGGSVCS